MRVGALLVLVLLALLSGVALADQDLVRDSNARAEPPTPGAVATHHISTGTEAAPDNTSITGLTLRYERPRNFSLGDDTGLEPYVFRNAGTPEYRTEILHPSHVSIEDRTIHLQFAGNVSITAADTVGIEVENVRNPPEPGPLNVTLTVNPEGPNRTAVDTALSISTPTPTLSNQGQVGDYQRIAIRWPGDVSGFVVARTTDSEIVGITHFDTVSTTHADIPLPNLANESAVTPGSTIILTAYHDTDENGTFDPETDPVFTSDGKNISIEVTNSFQQTTTSTTSATTPTPTTSTTTRATTDTGETTPTTTTTTITIPGFGIGASLVALLGAGLLARRRWD